MVHEFDKFFHLNSDVAMKIQFAHGENIVHHKLAILGMQIQILVNGKWNHKCTYLENGQNLAIEQGKSVQEIFPLPLQFQAQNSLVSDSLKYLSKQIQNFSLPELKNPKTYRSFSSGK